MLLGGHFHTELQANVTTLDGKIDTLDTRLDNEIDSLRRDAYDMKSQIQQCVKQLDDSKAREHVLISKLEAKEKEIDAKMDTVSPTDCESSNASSTADIPYEQRTVAVCGNLGSPGTAKEIEERLRSFHTMLHVHYRAT